MSTTLTAVAQEKPIAELTGGYQFLRLDGLNVPVGWDASVNVPTNSWLGLVGDFGGATKSVSGVNATIYTFGGGPQFTLRTHSVEPYFRLVLGAARFGASRYGLSASTTAFLVEPGGGADFYISDRLSLRLGANYPLARKSGVTADGIEALVGITYRFGKKRRALNDAVQASTDIEVSANAATIAALGVVVDKKVRIVRFLPNSQLSHQGLTVGDIIISVGETEVRNPQDLASATALLAKGSRVRIGYLIHGQWQSSREVDF